MSTMPNDEKDYFKLPSSKNDCNLLIYSLLQNANSIFSFTILTSADGEGVYAAKPLVKRGCAWRHKPGIFPSRQYNDRGCASCSWAG